MRWRRALVTMTTSKRSSPSAPRPIQMGRYGVRNGRKALARPMGTYPSVTVVATCRATNPTQNSDTLRCTRCERKRGHRSVAHPTAATMPMTTLTVRRTRATTPLARVRYHSALPPVAAAG